jgi:hypothetical protein
MESLTVAEYAVVLAELSWPGAPDRTRVRASGLPDSTYHVARRRLLAEGWMRTYPVPVPAALGIHRVEVAFARPSLSTREPLLHGWAARPECVALFSGLHSVLGIFLGGDPARAGSPDKPVGTVTCSIDATGGSVPVFLDLSGAWARFGGRARPERYPSGLEVRGEPAGERARRSARDVFRGEADPAVPGTASNGSPSSPGAITTGAWLDIARVPPFEGRRLGEVIYVHGQLRPGTEALPLLTALTAECSVFPFLYATSGRTVLLAGLGQTSASAAGRRPVPSAAAPVQSVLLRHLEPVEVTLEPVEAHRTRVLHRYGPALDARARVPPIAGQGRE